MKRGTLEHFKTMRLATLLSVERPCDRAEALGILEALCNHFAPRSTPQGNVGRCTDEEIAVGCGSTRSPRTLVAALLESGWLEEHPDHRLIIHDWHDHADEAVRKWLKRNKKPWLTTKGRRLARVETASRQRLDGVDPPRAGNGNGCSSSQVSGFGGVQGEPLGFEGFWSAYPKHRAKGAARKAWQKLRPGPALEAMIVGALARLRNDPQWQKDGGQFIPNPATWLNAEGWLDETLPGTVDGGTRGMAMLLGKED